MTVFEELKARGLVAQTTDEEKIKELIDKGKFTFYIGFDPTADSLHVGHFLQLVVMSRLQRAGHRPIALLGSGTTMIGDPSGKSDMRKMLTREDIERNAECFKDQMRLLVDFSDGRALMIQNGDWLFQLNYINFLREVGRHFSVNRMLAAECYKSRMETGLTFLEFNYMIMQSYDFLHLFREFDCVMQMGGDDQWSNIIGGVELIRRATGKEAYGLTFTLLTTSEGHKMGKTEKGAVWLDPSKTSPYEFYQYWRNVQDSDVINCLKLLTFIPLEEIEEMSALSGNALNAVKERLAWELTMMVHGREEADRAKAAAHALFSAGRGGQNMPTTVLSMADIPKDFVTALDLLLLTKLAPSKSEARRLIDQGGVEINDKRVVSYDDRFDAADFKEGGLLIKKGKKTYHRVTL